MTKRKELFEKVYIKSEDDLPKTDGYYFVVTKPDTDRQQDLFYYGGKGYNEQWLEYVAYYLRPVEQKELDVPSDEEIENYLWEEINIPLSEQDRLNNTQNYKIYKETFLWIRWAIDEIKRRNK